MGWLLTDILSSISDIKFLSFFLFKPIKIFLFLLQCTRWERISLKSVKFHVLYFRLMSMTNFVSYVQWFVLMERFPNPLPYNHLKKKKNRLTSFFIYHLYDSLYYKNERTIFFYFLSWVPIDPRSLFYYFMNKILIKDVGADGFPTLTISVFTISLKKKIVN